MSVLARYGRNLGKKGNKQDGSKEETADPHRIAAQKAPLYTALFIRRILMWYSGTKRSKLC